jgi:hypothetical protein
MVPLFFYTKKAGNPRPQVQNMESLRALKIEVGPGSFSHLQGSFEKASP